MLTCSIFIFSAESVILLQVKIVLCLDAWTHKKEVVSMFDTNV